MPQNEIAISGTTLNQQTKTGIANLKVQAWDNDLVINNSIGEAATDADGKFTITISQEHLDRLFINRRPALFFKIFKEERLIHSTKNNVTWTINNDGKDLEIFIDAEADHFIGNRLNEMRQIKRTKALKYADIVSIEGDAIKRLVDLDVDMDHINGNMLEQLVKDRILTSRHVDDLVLVSKLSQLSGENIDLIKAVRTNNITSPVDLVKWNESDWINLIKDKGVSLPTGEESPESYAVNLRANIERSFPTEYLLHRTIDPGKAADISALSERISPLIQDNIKLFEGETNEPSFNAINRLKESDPDKAKQLEQDLLTLRPLVNTYRYMGMAEVIESTAPLQEKQVSITGKLNALNQFYENNAATIDFNYADFSGDLNVKADNLNWDGIEAPLRPLIKRQMAAYQRAFILGEVEATASRLLQEGYDSAMRIVSVSEKEFIKSSGLGTEKGRRVYGNANDLATGSSHYLAAIRDATNGSYLQIPVSNQHPLVNDLREIDGFDKLFGSQNYCNCEHCRSIFSPAAYFTDLMYFVQERVSKKHFTGTKIVHPLYLKRRRPDLWTLTLSCENTNTEISYLQVVNEVLENYLATELSVSDIYQFLKIADWSVEQPFNLDLEELRLYLSHFDLKLYDLYRDMKVGLTDSYRERLKLSPEELALITTVNTATAIKRFNNTALDNFNVQHFIDYAGITRNQLDDLLQSSFLPEIAQVKINLVKDTSDIQRFREELKNLTASRLDLIHRYLRLWKKTSWSLKEFDLILLSMKSANLLTSLESTGHPGFFQILQLAQVMSFQSQFNLTIEELVTIIFKLPQKNLAKDERSFAERIFNLEKLASDLPTDKTPFLLAGLGITEGELSILLKLLSVNHKQPIGIAALSNLYRHARIAKGLRLTIEDFANALLLVLNGQPLTGFGSIENLIVFVEWVSKSPLTISDLVFILKGNETASVQYKSTLENMAEKITAIQKSVNIKEETDAAKKLENKKDLFKEYLRIFFNLTAHQLDNEFLPLAGKDNFNNAAAKAFNAVFTDNKPQDANDFNDLLAIQRQLERYLLLFNKHLFTAETISYLLNKKEVAGINDFKSLKMDDIKYISVYKKLLPEDEELRIRLQKALHHFQVNVNFNGHEATLAELWQQPVSLVESLLKPGILKLSKPALGAVNDLWNALKLCIRLGVQGDSFVKLLEPDYRIAAEIALGAFSSKYDEENTRNEKLEPYLDKLNTIKRDALCDYIVSRSDTFKFKDRRDLYAFFLLDVDMSGCFRTSRVVAAITSLQLYVYRCLTNLEQSEKDLNQNIADIKVLPNDIPLYEWEWRKNYRLWEANRKVFLYPENYIDPTLRNTRSHIFKDLEDELLQQKITKESAEAAYKKYMAQFAELTRLRYAGAYYHSVWDNGYIDLSENGLMAYYPSQYIYYPVESYDSCYYLFARTNVMPYQYFYRTYNHYKQTWGNWIKIELGIEAKEISTLIFQGRLFIFWSEVKSKEMVKVDGGTSSSEGYIFNVYVKYSFLDENKKWSAPQRLAIGQAYDSNENIFRRSRNIFLFDSGKWEKEKDSIIADYEQKVFRKPYAFTQQTEINNPIGLGFIWSHEKTNTIEVYSSDNFYYDDGTYRFFIPKMTFDIINSDFSHTLVPINTHATVNNNGNWDMVINLEGTFEMTSDLCFFQGIIIEDLIILGVPVKQLKTIYAPIPFKKESFSPIKESLFNLSLSKNIITNSNEENIFLSSSSPIKLYKEEYNVSYNENGNMVTFIENGTSYMSDHKIRQTVNGIGNLNILKENIYNLISLNTILTDEITDILFAKGIEQFLSLQTQDLADSNGNQLKFSGPYGEYYWEMFFHIPFLIANHFNANQKFKEAKWWYERIFNPTSEETPANVKPSDHNWQFTKFRGLTPQKLKDILTNGEAIEVYKKDPFDPHAIARLRISAYQKAIVMKYIDNLIDWGDYLFAQDTRESINEAEMLYHLAYSILGKKPVKTGSCKTSPDDAMTYKNLAPELEKGSEFLILLENVYMVQKNTYTQQVGSVQQSKSLQSLVDDGTTPVDLDMIKKQVHVRRTSDLFKDTPAAVVNQVSNRNFSSRAVRSYGGLMNERKRTTEMQAGNRKVKSASGMLASADNILFEPQKRSPSLDVARQINLAFCVPENKELLAYWERVEDRLFKIWNCMNISGIRRSLSLFQPPIDPMMLVRLRASGLSLDNMLASLNEETPHYRFGYLIEKAKQFTQTVQGFGASLLSALEKKDGEELLLLRTVHEKNILQLTREIKKKGVKEAQYQYLTVQEGGKNVQNRIDYYSSLISEGLIPWENVEQVSKFTASGIRVLEASFGFLSGVFGLIPQAGSPFAMKYGGQELDNSVKGLAMATGTLAAIADNIAASAGLIASHQRREQEWKQQLKLAQQELSQVNQQLLAAEIRQQIAEKDLEVHERNAEQLDELHDFYKDKFTNLGLYNYLASSLNRLYRSAYTIAYELARLAEKAYQFERFDDNIYIQGDNWQFDKAGFLAGEKLQLQLQQLEKRYIESNKRIPEITQSFSLAMLNPSQLTALRQTGECDITIPEIAFELLYPGQYRRIIKSVSLTIPCVAGPYTNISAQLTLMGALIKKTDKGNLDAYDIAKDASITASSANNDSGMFNLNFNDERYLPFEGAGAISNWNLRLPSMMRSFNYDTIADVILHMSYTAMEGDRFTAENTLGALVMNYAQNGNGLFRLLSLKHEFPAEFHRLFTQDKQTTDFTVTRQHFPYVFFDKALELFKEVKVYIKPTKGNAVSLPDGFKLNGLDVKVSSGDDIALPGANGETDKIKAGTVEITGNPLTKWTINTSSETLDKDLVEDILILLRYKI